MYGIKKRIIEIGLFLAIATGAISVSALTASVAETGDTVVYSSSINMRADMSESSLTGNIVTPGEALTYLDDDGTSNGWTKVRTGDCLKSPFFQSIKIMIFVLNFKI